MIMRHRFLQLLLMGVLGCQSGLAADIVVNSHQTINPFADDGQCTLPEAVNASNTNQASGLLPGECAAGEIPPQVDTILFDVDILPVVITLESALVLSESVKILGQHKDLVTIGGIGSDRIVEVNGFPGHYFQFSDLTITGGYAPIGVPPVSMGGGMMVSLSSSSLRIERVKFENNNAEYAGGALAIAYGGTQNNTISVVQTEFFNNQSIGSVTQANNNQGGGGAIFIGGYQTVEIEQSTFADNEAGNFSAPLPTGDGMGGAIWMLSSSSLAESTLVIDSSTFDNNAANGVGGALAVGGPGFPADYSLVDIKHSTFIGNTADKNQSDTGQAGGGIYSSATAAINIMNNVIAKNRDFSSDSRANISGYFNTFGHNFINGNNGISADFPMGAPNANNDFVVPAIASPELMPLADNGGPTLTRAIETGSPLVDQGKCGNAYTDQRDFYNADGLTRAHDNPTVPDLVDGCDIGAFETGTDSENTQPNAAQELYSILEDTILTVTDVDGTLTPAIDNDNGLLANDIDSDPLWVTNAGIMTMQSSDMTDPGEINLRADGLFTYTPASDENGFAFQEYTVSDQYNQQTVTFGIDVIPVNDAPEFVVDGATTFGFGDLIQPIEYENWAIDINAGAANETGQTLTFDLVYLQGDDSFFEVVPSIDSSTGTLTFEVADTANGTVEMRVFLTDDGGTENGGVDTSPGADISIGRSLSDVIFENSFEPINGL